MAHPVSLSGSVQPLGANRGRGKLDPWGGVSCRGSRVFSVPLPAMKPQSPLVLVGALLCTCTAAPVPKSEDQPSRARPLAQIYSDLEKLFARTYPAATPCRLEDSFHFEYDTRVFLVHEQLKTGEWQDAFEVRGPKPGGILCDITLQKGPYPGAAVVPQAFDKRYFTLLVMAPESPERDAHLYVRLLYPPNVSADFLRDFTKLVDGFGPTPSN